MKKSKKSVENARTKIGYTFVIHWILGMVLFFLYPLVNSAWYSFNNVRISAGKIITEFIGLKYYNDLLTVDPNYLDNLMSSIGQMFYSLPIIISLSLILAVLLNQQFKGRTVFRVIFFLPVIMTNSVVMNILTGDMITMPLFSSGQEGTGIINYNEIISSLSIPSFIRPFLVFMLSNTISLIWKCGVQTILFIAGLQSIPKSLYEVSKIEGANKWEEFWLITVPSLRNIISLVFIYTMIELFVDMDNIVVKNAYNRLLTQDFGIGSAMLWIYFVIVIAVIGTIYILYQRFCIKRWE